MEAGVVRGTLGGSAPKDITDHTNGNLIFEYVLSILLSLSFNLHVNVIFSGLLKFTYSI